MATIYRFIVESGGSGGSTKSGTGGAKSKGVRKPRTPKEKKLTGVEFNRYQRITTTLGNKMTNGIYSPALRFGKAVVSSTSAIASGEVPILGIMIIVQTLLRVMSKELDYYKDRASQENTADMKRLEVGEKQIYNSVSVSKNILTGRIKLNEND